MLVVASFVNTNTYFIESPHKKHSNYQQISDTNLVGAFLFVTGPTGHAVPAQVHQTADGVFKAEFVPRTVGEHRVSVTVQGQPTAGSPYSAKVCLTFLTLNLSQ